MNDRDVQREAADAAADHFEQCFRGFVQRLAALEHHRHARKPWRLDQGRDERLQNSCRIMTAADAILEVADANQAGILERLDLSEGT